MKQYQRPEPYLVAEPTGRFADGFEYGIEAFACPVTDPMAKKVNNSVKLNFQRLVSYASILIVINYRERKAKSFGEIS